MYLSTCHSKYLSIGSSTLSKRPTNATLVSGSLARERQTLGAEERKILNDLHLELFEVNAEVGSEYQHPILRQEVEDDSNMPMNDRFEHLLRDA